MHRRTFLQTASLFAAAPFSVAAAGRKPNIVLILAAELGIGNVSCYGADNFRTPHIDSLAGTGTRYTHCYTSPLCGPSLARIFTGRYAFRTGATSQDSVARLDPSVETMLPSYLKAAGYVPAAFGRWGPLPLTPLEFGFDVYRKDADPLDFITTHRADPFFVYYSLSSLHPPILRSPDSKPDSRDFYSDNISYIDKLVGNLVAGLDRLRLRDNTLIVFTSDNGTGGVYAAESTVGGRRLAGEKGSMLEGGALVPLIVNWPGRLSSGKVSSNLVDSADFLPTFTEFASATLPPDKVLDGRSLSGPPRDWVFVDLGKNWYVRDVAWKLNQAGQLFDMSKSPFEEPLVPPGAPNPARQRLQAILDNLNPAAGIRDAGDGSGRHQGRLKHTKKP